MLLTLIEFAAGWLAPPHFVRGLPHVYPDRAAAGWLARLISYQDYHMLLTLIELAAGWLARLISYQDYHMFTLPTLAMARQDAILLTGHMCSVTCAAIARCEPQGLVPGCPAGYIERPLVQGPVRSVGARCTSTLPPLRCDYNITFDIVNYAHV